MFWVLLYIFLFYYFLAVYQQNKPEEYKKNADTLSLIGLFIIACILFSLPGVFIINSFDPLPYGLGILLIFIIGIVIWVSLFKISRWYSRKKSDYNFKTKYGKTRKTKSEQEAIEKFQKNRREIEKFQKNRREIDPN